MSRKKYYRHSEKVFDLSLPVDGPLSSEDFFAERPPATGLPPCRRMAIGCAGMGLGPDRHDGKKGIEILHSAWRAGFRMTDTARAYGDGERILGEAARSWSGDPPVIATKFGGPEFSTASLSPQWAESRRLLHPAKISLLALHDTQICPPEQWDEAQSYLRECISEDSLTGGGIAGGDPDVVIDAMRDNDLSYVMTYNRISVVTLQGLTDVVPAARRRGVAIFAGSPLMMGLLGAKYEQMIGKVHWHCPPPILARAGSAKALADEMGIPLSQLALRMLLSMPSVDVVVAGASRQETWVDCRTAYEAGPLPGDVYERLWQIAQQGVEPINGF